MSSPGLISHFILLLYNIPLCGYTIVYLSTHLLKNILVASEFLDFFFFFFFFFFTYLFIYFWLCWVFVSVPGLSPVVVSGAHSSSRCVGLSLSRPLPLWSTGSRRAGSVVVAHCLSCSTACGIFPEKGSNPCVPCIGRQILNHCTTREAPLGLFFILLF